MSETTPRRPPRLLKLAVAADDLGVSTRTVKRYIKAGLLAAVRLPSPSGRGHLRIDERELARFKVENGWLVWVLILASIVVDLSLFFTII